MTVTYLSLLLGGECTKGPCGSRDPYHDPRSSSRLFYVSRTRSLVSSRTAHCYCVKFPIGPNSRFDTLRSNRPVRSICTSSVYLSYRLMVGAEPSLSFQSSEPRTGSLRLATELARTITGGAAKAAFPRSNSVGRSRGCAERSGFSIECVVCSSC